MKALRPSAGRKAPAELSEQPRSARAVSTESAVPSRRAGHELLGDLELDEERRAIEVAGATEQRRHDRRRHRVRQVPGDADTRRQPLPGEREGIAGGHRETRIRQHPPEVRGPGQIELDREHPGSFGEQSPRQDPAARADLDDRAPGRGEKGDERPAERGSAQMVLAEGATAPGTVARRLHRRSFWHAPGAGSLALRLHLAPGGRGF